MRRQQVRRQIVEALTAEFPDVKVSDNALLRFKSDTLHLVVSVLAEDVDEVDTDSGGQVTMTLAIRSASDATNQQDVLDDLFDEVSALLEEEGFAEQLGVVEITYDGYEFGTEDGYATGTASYEILSYEEVA